MMALAESLPEPLKTAEAIGLGPADLGALLARELVEEEHYCVACAKLVTPVPVIGCLWEVDGVLFPGAGDHISAEGKRCGPVTRAQFSIERERLRVRVEIRKAGA